jgi:hypothetical protein
VLHGKANRIHGWFFRFGARGRFAFLANKLLLNAIVVKKIRNGMSGAKEAPFRRCGQDRSRKLGSMYGL